MMASIRQKRTKWTQIVLFSLISLSASCGNADREDVLPEKIKSIIDAYNVEGAIKNIIINRALELHAQELLLRQQAAEIKAFIGYLEKTQELLRKNGEDEVSVTTLEAIVDAMILGLPDELIVRFVQYVPDDARGPIFDRISRCILAGMSIEDAATLVALEYKIPLLLR